MKRFLIAVAFAAGFVGFGAPDTALAQCVPYNFLARGQVTAPENYRSGYNYVFLPHRSYAQCLWSLGAREVCHECRVWLNTTRLGGGSPAIRQVRAAAHQATCPPKDQLAGGCGIVVKVPLGQPILLPPGVEGVVAGCNTAVTRMQEAWPLVRATAYRPAPAGKACQGCGRSEHLLFR